jgi:tetrahydromethanopterin S-methyltransferase subunit F
MDTWLLELGTALGKLFLHPLVYVYVLCSILLGYIRMVRERKQFSVRVYDIWYEIRTTIISGIVVGLLFSVLTLGVGIALPFEMVLVIEAVSILGMMCLLIRWLSPAYTISIAVFLVIVLKEMNTGIDGLNKIIAGANEFHLTNILMLLVLLLIIEGILLLRGAERMTTPLISISKRGKRAGEHLAKRVWMVPLFLLVPGEGVQAIASWWPVISLGDGTYSIVFVPFVIGIMQKMKGMIPKDGIVRTGKLVLGLASIVGVCAIISYWNTFIGLLALSIAIIGREAISIVHHLQDDSKQPYFSSRPNGVVIVGILSSSAATKMGLRIGEVITKANGVSVRTEKEFYEALQKNRAFCKLEVIDVNNEPRFAQTALYEGGHHELGVLLVGEDATWEMEVSS